MVHATTEIVYIHGRSDNVFTAGANARQALLKPNLAWMSISLSKARSDKLFHLLSGLAELVRRWTHTPIPIHKRLTVGYGKHLSATR
jgi:hypothetical protein